MTRLVTLGAAQLGPVQRDHTRKDVVERLLELLRQGAEHGCDLVVFPELALTTFFPRWFVTDDAELDQWYETAMPGPDTQVLFDEAARLGVGFSLGYAELKVDDETGSGTATTPRSSSSATARSSAPTARCTCRVTSRTSRGGPSSIWRSATSSPAPTGSGCGGRTAESWAWRSATTGAGPRPTG